MIKYTSAELSHILYANDPMDTCCNVNDGMENEYDNIAAAIVENSITMSNEEAMKQAIVFWFDDYLYGLKKAKLNECLL